MTLGNLAYNAWRHSLEDESVPKWEDIRPQEKIAWEYAAETIREWVEKSTPHVFPELAQGSLPRITFVEAATVSRHQAARG
jgi:hypothetical protein